MRCGNEASAKEGEGAGRGPCGLRNSELGPLPQKNEFALNNRLLRLKIFYFRTNCRENPYFKWFCNVQIQYFMDTCIEDNCVF